MKLGTRGLVTAVIGSLIVGMCAGTAWGANAISLIVDGKRSSAEVLLKNGVTYVPLRAAAELLGSEVQWDGAARAVRIESNGSEAGVQYVKDFRFSGMTVTEQNGLTLITAEIRNDSDKKAAAVMFGAVFYDKAGARLGNAVGTAVNLERGESATVHMLTDDRGLLSDYASVRYQIRQVL